MLLTAFVWVALIGMVWNVGEYSYRKQIAQDAADSAAYGTAQWMSRGLNLVTGTNMAMVRNASAMGIAEGHWLAQIGVAYSLYKIYPAVQWWPPAWVPYGIEVVRLAKLIATTAQPCYTAITTLPERQKALAKFQRAIVEGIPNAIDLQRSRQEQFSFHTIRIVKPGQTGDDEDRPIELPVRLLESRVPMQFSVATHRRISRDSDSWDADYRQFKMGRGMFWWTLGVHIGAQAAVALPRRDHHVLITSNEGILPMEVDSDRLWKDMPFTKEQRLEHFTVVAAAEPVPFIAGPRPVLTQYFSTPSDPVAYAQAETFNGMNASYFVRLNNWFVLPWRMWSKPGWNWRPRLAGGDGIEEAMINDPKLRRKLLGYFAPTPESETAHEPIGLH